MEHRLYQFINHGHEDKALGVWTDAPDLDVNYHYPITPLDTLVMRASLRKMIRVLKKLVDHGADIDTKDKYGLRAVQIAAYSGFEEGTLFLLQKGCDPHVLGIGEETLLMWAAETGMISVMQHLLNIGVDVQAVDMNKRTALDYACDAAQDVAACLLVQHLANTDDHFIKHMTIMAKKKRMPRLARMLSIIPAMRPRILHKVVTLGNAPRLMWRAKHAAASKGLSVDDQWKAIKAAAPVVLRDRTEKRTRLPKVTVASSDETLAGVAGHLVRRGLTQHLWTELMLMLIPSSDSALQGQPLGNILETWDQVMQPLQG